MEGRPQPIQLTEIEAFTRLRKWDDDLIADLLYCIDALEDVYFTWWQAQQKKQKSGKNVGKGTPIKAPRR